MGLNAGAALASAGSEAHNQIEGAAHIASGGVAGGAGMIVEEGVGRKGVD